MFQDIFNLAISFADLHCLLAPEESPNWKNQFSCSPKKTLSLDIKRP